MNEWMNEWIATRYGLDGPGIVSRNLDRPQPSKLALGAHPVSCTMVTGFFPGIRRPGRGVEERVELYSPSGLLWRVLCWTLLLPLPLCPPFLLFPFPLIILCTVVVFSSSLFMFLRVCFNGGNVKVEIAVGQVIKGKRGLEIGLYSFLHCVRWGSCSASSSDRFTLEKGTR